MSSRVNLMRRKLFDELIHLQTPGDWSHIVKQSGMFSYTGISPAQIAYLQGWSTVPYFDNSNKTEEKYHIYMADTSRISIAGLNEGNVTYFAKALDGAVRLVR